MTEPKIPSLDDFRRVRETAHAAQREKIINEVLEAAVAWREADSIPTGEPDEYVKARNKLTRAVVAYTNALKEADAT